MSLTEMPEKSNQAILTIVFRTTPDLRIDRQTSSMKYRYGALSSCLWTVGSCHLASKNLFTVFVTGPAILSHCWLLTLFYLNRSLLVRL